MFPSFAMHLIRRMPLSHGREKVRKVLYDRLDGVNRMGESAMTYTIGPIRECKKVPFVLKSSQDPSMCRSVISGVLTRVNVNEQSLIWRAPPRLLFFALFVLFLLISYLSLMSTSTPSGQTIESGRCQKPICELKEIQELSWPMIRQETSRKGGKVPEVPARLWTR